jgi:hypothetical protein
MKSNLCTNFNKNFGLLNCACKSIISEDSVIILNKTLSLIGLTDWYLEGYYRMK